ncbi:MAG: putative Ig domain-containing protein [Actinobacteria bacterium]|nr:putative Ig domain-containing protein [Actinomycetota bacterium]
MKRLIAAIAGSALILGGLLASAPQATAAGSNAVMTCGAPSTVMQNDQVTVTWGVAGVADPTYWFANMQVMDPTGTAVGTVINFGYPAVSTTSGSISFSADKVGKYHVYCFGPNIDASDVYIDVLPIAITSCSVSVVGDQATVRWSTAGSGFGSFDVGVAKASTATKSVPGDQRTATVSLASVGAGLITITVKPQVPGTVQTPFACPEVTYTPATPVPPVVTPGVFQINQGVRQQQLSISWSEPPMIGWKSANFLGTRSILSNETSIWVDCGFTGDFVAVSSTVGNSAPVRVSAACAPITATLTLTPLDAHSVQGTFTFTPDLSVVETVRYWTLIDGQPGPTIRATAPPGPGTTMTFVIPGLPAGKDVTVLSQIGVVGNPFSVSPRATTTMPAAGAALQYQGTTVATGTAFSVPPTFQPQGQTFTVSAVPALPLTVDAGGTVRGTAPAVTKTTVHTVTVTSANPAETATFTLTITPLPGASAATAATRPGAGASTGGIPGTGPVGGSTGNGGASSGSIGAGSAPAPCLAPDGEIYPDLAGSVGSTLTMAPNLTGLRPATNFSIVGGSLPQGIWLDSDVGVVSGTPLQSNGGWGPVTVRAAFADGTTEDSSFNIAVDDPHHSANYPNRIIGSIGQEVVISPLEVHTHGTTTFRIVCGSLPQGLKFNTEIGQISGTPTALVERPVPLRVRMTDAYGWVDTSFIIVVNQGLTPWLRYPDYAQLDRNSATIIDPTRSGLPGDTRYTITGRLPKGLVFDKVSGAIYGKPVVAVGSVFRPTVRAVDKKGNVIASTWANLTVTKPAVPMKVKARSAARRLTVGTFTLVTSVKHPALSRLSANVKCTACTHTFNKRTGRLVIRVTKAHRLVRVHIAAVPIGAANREAYSSHVWSRAWHVR